MIYEADFNANLIQITIACGLAVVVTAAIVTLMRVKGKAWMVAGCFVLVTGLLFLHAEYREVGHHGFMHVSQIYTMIEQGFPPEDPLFAGEPLRYPYMVNAILAHLMRLVPISPGIYFALLNMVALAATTYILYKAASLVCFAPTFCILAVVLSMAGGPLIDGPAVGALEALGAPREVRHLPYSKFAGAGSNQIGYLLFVLALYACMQLARTPVRRRYYLILLGIATIGAGLFYTFSWLAICTSVFVTTVVVLTTRDRKMCKTSFHAVIIIALASAVVLPYTLLISSGRSAESGLKILPGFASMFRSLEVALLAVAPVAILAVIYRKRMVTEFREHTRIMALLLVWFFIPCVLSIVTFVPVNCQYKFLGHGLLALGLITAIPVEMLYYSRKIAAIAFIFLLLISMMWHHATIFRTSWPAIDPVYSDGAYLRHRDDNEDALYTWIASNTPANSVFLDTQLTIPVFGRRSLYVVMDRRKDRLFKTNPRVYYVVDGWGMNARYHQQGVAGHPRRQVEQRLALAAAMLSATSEPIKAQSLAQFREEVPGRPVYVVARDNSVQSRLLRDQRMRLSYKGIHASVFLVEEETLAEEVKLQ